jgi:hypothetical protein
MQRTVHTLRRFLAKFSTNVGALDSTATVDLIGTPLQLGPIPSTAPDKVRPTAVGSLAKFTGVKETFK